MTFTPQLLPSIPLKPRQAKGPGLGRFAYLCQLLLAIYGIAGLLIGCVAILNFELRMGLLGLVMFVTSFGLYGVIHAIGRISENLSELQASVHTLDTRLLKVEIGNLVQDTVQQNALGEPGDEEATP